jgi:hypothetical protein
MNHCHEINGKTLAIRRRGLVRLCSLRDEYYEFVENPVAFLQDLKRNPLINADLFTFIQSISDTHPRFAYHLEFDRTAVLFLTTYEHWWEKQINGKTRNMVRKAQKAGVEIRSAEFGDDLIRGIQTIYNESPVRQGRPFWHYGKSLEMLRREHGTFLDQSQFFGAYYDGELIGFIKLVHGDGVSSLMNILSMISRRDKAPTNALISKAVEICAERGVPRLQYGTGNAGSLGDFKKHHAFQEVRVPRYYVPLNSKAAVALRLGLHHRFDRYLPENWRNRLLKFRTDWFAFQNAKSRVVGRIARTT